MSAVNKAMDPAKLQGVMAQFQQESMKMDAAGEMSACQVLSLVSVCLSPQPQLPFLFWALSCQLTVDDTLDGVMDDDGMEEESTAILNEVLDGIAMGAQAAAPRAPSSRLPTRAPAAAAAEDDAETDALLARLAALKS